FAFDGLQSQSTYELEIDGATHQVEGLVRTLTSEPTSLNIGAVSCNFFSRREDTDLWADLGARYVETGDLHMLIHLGDQVYADNVWEFAERLVGDDPIPSQASRDTILERWRELYRTQWTHPSVAAVLARVPNLMIWDDHEIR